MGQKGLFDDEFEKPGDASGGDDFEGFSVTKKASRKFDKKIILGIGGAVVAIALAAGYFLLNKEEPAAPPPPARIPIKKAPAVMGNVTGTKATAEKPLEAKPVKTEDAKVPPKAEAKKDVPVPVDLKKAEKPVAAKEKVKAEVKPEEGVKGEGLAIIIGTYFAKYEIDEAKEKLKGISYKVKETKKKYLMHRVLAKEGKEKDEVTGVVSDLKAKGYEPFVAHDNGKYKVYAVSNINEALSAANKAELEKLGYHPVIENKEVPIKVHQLIVRAKSRDESRELTERLKKLGFKPEEAK